MSLVKTFLELKASISSKTYRLLVVPAKLRALFISRKEGSSMAKGHRSQIKRERQS